MILNIPFKLLNVENKVQLSISEGTKATQRIVRESAAEHLKDSNGNFIHSEVDGKPYLINTSNNYFLLEGILKVTYKWKEGDSFNLSHRDEFESIVNSASASPDLLEKTDDSISGVYTCTMDTSSTWTSSATKIEPNCSIASVEIMKDDTVMLCPMQHSPGWTFEKTDIPVGGSFTSNKVGTDEYIVFGQQCKIGGQVINKHASKKQTSNSIVIENDSDSFCRLVRIYK
tara:strand:- start:5019 stop:5705 length:687 start_codon:yes stop_codon:yes gene_type:complete